MSCQLFRIAIRSRVGKSLSHGFDLFGKRRGPTESLVGGCDARRLGFGLRSVERGLLCALRVLVFGAEPAYHARAFLGRALAV